MARTVLALALALLLLAPTVAAINEPRLRAAGGAGNKDAGVIALATTEGGGTLRYNTTAGWVSLTVCALSDSHVIPDVCHVVLVAP